MSSVPRRQLGIFLAAMERTASRLTGAALGGVESYLLRPNGWMPNNERLPVLWYRSAFDGQGDLALRMERVFGANGWPAAWRNGVYPFHHYHSTAHEVLGFARGKARILLGGENGKEVAVRAGDVVLLPCGTGHCRVEASSDFLVVGAYPEGQDWDLCRSAPDAAMRERMRRLPFPSVDPVQGVGGSLVQFWKA